jgi:hypothetical protein
LPQTLLGDKNQPVPRWWRRLRDRDFWLEEPKWVGDFTRSAESAALRRSVRRLHKALPGYLDVSEFYDGDERRRESPERALGDDWRDAGGVSHRLFWVELTGELCVAVNSSGRADGSAAGSPYGMPVTSWPPVSMTVPMKLLGAVASESALDKLLTDGASLHGERGGVEWLESRLNMRS